jgi:hypothetical protein
MRNPAELAHLFADIMNSHDASRFAELVCEFRSNPATDSDFIPATIPI